MLDVHGVIRTVDQTKFGRTCRAMSSFAASKSLCSSVKNKIAHCVYVWHAIAQNNRNLAQILSVQIDRILTNDVCLTSGFSILDSKTWTILFYCLRFKLLEMVWLISMLVWTLDEAPRSCKLKNWPKVLAQNSLKIIRERNLLENYVCRVWLLVAATDNLLILTHLSLSKQSGNKSTLVIPVPATYSLCNGHVVWRSFQMIYLQWSFECPSIEQRENWQSILFSAGNLCKPLCSSSSVDSVCRELFSVPLCVILFVCQIASKCQFAPKCSRLEPDYS